MKRNLVASTNASYHAILLSPRNASVSLASCLDPTTPVHPRRVPAGPKVIDHLTPRDPVPLACRRRNGSTEPRIGYRLAVIQIEKYIHDVFFGLRSFSLGVGRDHRRVPRAKGDRMI